MYDCQGQNRHAREKGKEEHDHRRAFPFIAKIVDERVRKPCAQTAQNAYECGDSGGRSERGFDNEQRAKESYGDKKPVFPTRLFTQNDCGKKDSEEGGKLVQNRSVGNRQMVDCIEIANDTHRARNRTGEKGGQTALFDFERFAFAKHDKGDKRRYGVSKKAFLKGGQIPRKTDEHPHKREEKCGKDDKENPPLGAFYAVSPTLRLGIGRFVFHLLQFFVAHTIIIRI